VVGLPAVVTGKVKAFPLVAVAAAALVKFGTGTAVPAAFTVRVKGWVVVPPLFFAIRVMA
jgi:hypothetical protein